MKISTTNSNQFGELLHFLELSEIFGYFLDNFNFFRILFVKFRQFSYFSTKITIKNHSFFGTLAIRQFSYLSIWVDNMGHIVYFAYNLHVLYVLGEK